jgi:hypothetical protein
MNAYLIRISSEANGRAFAQVVYVVGDICKVDRRDNVAILYRNDPANPREGRLAALVSLSDVSVVIGDQPPHGVIGP